MRSSKYADALLLASGGGQDLWLRTRDEYMRRQQDPFFRMVGRGEDGSRGVRELSGFIHNDQ